MSAGRRHPPVPLLAALAVGLAGDRAAAEDALYSTPVIQLPLDAFEQHPDVADLDGDGDLDAVQQVPFGLQVWLGAGGGTFDPGPRIDYGVYTQHLMPVFVDADNDGFLDVVTPNGITPSFQSAVVFHAGDGAGGLGAPVLSPASSATLAREAVGADVDHDGDADLLVCRTLTPAVLLYPGFGNGAFGAQQSIPVSGTVHDFAYADVTHDGIEDFVAVTNALTNRLVVLAGDGAGGYPATSWVHVPGMPERLELVDIDQSGRLDAAVITEGSNEVKTFLDAAASPWFTAKEVHALPGTPRAVEAGDFDGDGLADLLVGGDDVPLQLLRGDGAGGLAPPAPRTSVAMSTQKWMQAADVDGDGRLDLFLGQPFRLVLHDGLSGHTYRPIDRPPSSSRRVELADVDLDGDADLLELVGGGAFPQEVRVLVNNGGGEFTPGSVASLPGAGSAEPALADVDGSGSTDLLLPTSSGLRLARGDGAGGFALAGGQGLTGAFTLDLADFDLDGDLDVVENEGTGEVRLNDGGAGFAATIPVNQTAVLLFDVEAGDFDGDGDADAAQATLSTTATGNGPIDVVMLSGDGTGLLAESDRGIVGWDGVLLRSADVDGDGLPEVATSDWSVLVQDFGPGGGLGRVRHFTTRQIVQEAPPTFGDVDGDGRVDFVVPTVGGVDVLVSRGGIAGCPDSITSVGNGCPGAGGFVPLLSAEGCPSDGSAVTFAVSTGPGGAAGILRVGAAPGSVPFANGCVGYVLGLPPVDVPIVLGGVGPGAGGWLGHAPVPDALPAGTLFAQAFLEDAQAPLRFTATNAVRIDVP